MTTNKTLILYKMINVLGNIISNNRPIIKINGS